MKSQNGELLSVEDVAGILRTSKDTVHRLWRSGELGGYKLGHRTVRFGREDVDRYLEARRVAAR
jgi:excisionase family DNA binding protein